MKKATSKVTIHMVSSLDGFISRKNNDISWLQSTDRYEKGVTLTEEEIEEYVRGIDCYVMGSKTYEQALELGWPYGELPVFVLTQRHLSKERDNVNFWKGDLSELINDKLKPNYSNIWMVGGTVVTKEFLRLGLAEEIIISIMPILLGEGSLFFDFIGRECQLHLKDVTAYKDGMVELWYEIKK